MDLQSIEFKKELNTLLKNISVCFDTIHLSMNRSPDFKRKVFTEGSAQSSNFKKLIAFYDLVMSLRDFNYVSCVSNRQENNLLVKKDRELISLIDSTLDENSFHFKLLHQISLVNSKEVDPIYFLSGGFPHE